MTFTPRTHTHTHTHIHTHAHTHTHSSSSTFLVKLLLLSFYKPWELFGCVCVCVCCGKHQSVYSVLVLVSYSKT